jgi:acyl-coenzyme A thioesterase 13
MGAPASFSPVDDPGPFLEHVGPLLADGDVVGLEIGERHLNRAGTAQGGLLATLVDFAMGRAVRKSTDGERRAATVSLTTDFLGAAKEGDWVEARTEVERLGGTLAFVDCSLSVDDREIVRGRAVFAVLSDDDG